MASQMSASVLGSSVPRHAGARMPAAFPPCFPLPLAMPASLATSTGASLPTSLGGGVMPRTVHGFDLSALTSGYLVLSCSFGLQVLPVGGPNSAQLLSCLAISVVVNFASSDDGAAMGRLV